MKLRCPSCNRPVLSRRNRRCSFCSGPLPEGWVLAPDPIEAPGEEGAPGAAPSPVPVEESGGPTGLGPTLRQVMIVVAWAALMTAAARALYGWDLLGNTPEALCQSIPIYLGVYPMPLLAILIWLFDRPGRVRAWYASACLIAASFLGGVVFTLLDAVCYALAGKTTPLFPMWTLIGLLGFWSGWKQWQTVGPGDCPACGRRSVIPITVLLRPSSKRRYYTGKHGWCATCGARFDRGDDPVWRAPAA